jgi:VWFA-related protein
MSTLLLNVLGDLIRIKDGRRNTMKKLIIITITVMLAVILSAQEIRHQAIAVNVEVPVRVFKGDVFIDDLVIDDFELFEDGVKQKIDAVYLIKKTTIEREESELGKEVAMQRFAPKPTLRQFILVFEVIDYSPYLDDVIDHFFDHVYEQEDRLAVVTPLNTYHLNSDLFAQKSVKEVSDALKSKLKKDIRKGNAEYKSIMRSIVQGEATYIDYFRLKNMRRLEQDRLLEFADTLKEIEGQKNVFLLYQRDAVPRQASSIGNLSISDYLYTADELERDIAFDIDKVKQAFSDSMISAHFIYISGTEQYQQSVLNMRPSGEIVRDWSMQTFGALYEVAKATGGLADSSANPAASFQKASDATANYYLLYYTPKEFKADGKFRNIKVRVKGKNYKITHRAGYFAD